MYKQKTWQLEATGVDGKVQLFGVNIFECEWIATKKRIRVSDLSYEPVVYETMIHGVRYEFAAGERSNCVWNFYVYKY